MTLDALKRHLNTECQEFEVSCPSCRASITRKEALGHFKTQCKVGFLCQYCKQHTTYKDYDNHKCPGKAVEDLNKVVAENRGLLATIANLREELRVAKEEI